MFLTSYLSSLEGRPSLNSGGLFVDQSLFMETQLGTGESGLSFLLPEKQEPGFMFDKCCIFIISDKSLPLLNNQFSIFKLNRWTHRAVTIHGYTARFRGVCSLLLLWASTHHTDFSRDLSLLSSEMDNSHRQLEILLLPLSLALAAMFPRQSGFRGRTPLLSLLIHSRLETWTQTQYWFCGYHLSIKHEITFL